MHSERSKRYSKCYLKSTLVMRSIRKEYNAVLPLNEAIQQAKDTERNRKGYDPDWAGAKDVDDAIRQAGATTLRPLNGGQGSGLIYKTDVVGAAPIVGAFLAGRPDCMIRSYGKPTQPLNIEYYMSIAASVDARRIQRQLDILFDMVQRKQQQGYIVRLTLVVCVKSHEDRKTLVTTRIIVRDYNDYITPSVLHLISSVALFRVVLICLMERITTIANGTAVSYDAALKAKVIDSSVIDLMNLKAV